MPVKRDYTLRRCYCQSCNSWRCPYNKDGICAQREQGDNTCMPFYSDREYDRLMDLVWKDGKSFNTPEMPEESKQAYQEILNKFGQPVELKKDDEGYYYEENENKGE